MVSAVAAVSRPVSTFSKSGRKPPQTGWAFQPFPNLNRETRQAIGRRKAGWTFSVICTELGYAVHKGRANWQAPKLGIGLRAVARESGQSVGKVRRDVAALAELGLVVIVQPNVVAVRDPESGKIVRKPGGRCDCTLIVLAVDPAVHLRPSKVHPGTTGGITVAPPPAVSKVHPEPTVREETHTLTGCVSPSENKETADGLAVGIGQPTAAVGGGLAAAGTGTATAATGTPTGLPEASQGRRRLRCLATLNRPAGGGLAAATGAGRLSAADFEGVQVTDAERQARREQQTKRARDYAYHLGKPVDAVIELWQSDHTELMRQVIAAGVDWKTGRPLRRPSLPTADELRLKMDRLPIHMDALRREFQREIDRLDAAGTGVDAAESVTPDA